MCAHTPVYYTHTPPCFMNAKLVYGLRPVGSHTHTTTDVLACTHTYILPLPGDGETLSHSTAQSQQAQRVAETECIRFNSLGLIAP